MAKLRSAVKPWRRACLCRTRWPARLRIGGKPAPLLFSSDLQVNAMAPFDLEVNTRHQVLVRRGPTYARPVAVDVAAAQPAIFRLTETQGHIYRFTAGGRRTDSGAGSPSNTVKTPMATRSLRKETQVFPLGPHGSPARIIVYSALNAGGT